jgi:hypothetical protein
VIPLRFSGGPWDGRTLVSRETPGWFEVDGGKYRLVGYRHTTEHGDAAAYEWRQKQHEP